MWQRVTCICGESLDIRSAKAVTKKVGEDPSAADDDVDIWLTEEDDVWLAKHEPHVAGKHENATYQPLTEQLDS